MRLWRRDCVLFALILLLALALRLGAAVWRQTHLPEGQPFGFGDSETYWELARTIAAGEDYQFRSADARCFRSPGYPVLLSVVYLTVGDEPHVFWGRLTSVLSGAAAVGCVIWLSAILFNRRTAIFAGLIAAFYPGAIAMSALVLTEATFSALMLLQFIFWTYGWRSATRTQLVGWMTLAGIVAGAATLVRPSWLLFTPLAVALAMLFSRSRRRHALAGACLLVGLCLAMTPWWLRNFELYGQFVPTTLQVGASLYDGLNEQAHGGGDMDFVEPITREFRQREAERRGQGSEIGAQGNPPRSSEDPVENERNASFELRLDREFRSRAISWALDNPTRTAKLAVVKFTRTWNIWPNEPSFRSLGLRLVVLISYLPVTLLALVGAWRYSRRGWPYLLCLAPAAYFSLLHMIFVGSIRYRQPAMLALVVLAAAVVVEWLAYLRTGQTPRQARMRNSES